MSGLGCIPEVIESFVADPANQNLASTARTIFTSPLSSYRRRAPLEVPMIEANGLKKSFGEIEAVTDVSFAAQDGRVTGLLGPNGQASRQRCE